MLESKTIHGFFLLSSINPLSKRLRADTIDQNTMPESPSSPIHHHTFIGTLPSYFARRARGEVRELFLNAAILDLAIAMILLFEPIYLYQQGLDMRGIVLFYVGVYVLYFALMPFGGKFVKRFGFEHSMILGSVFLILYYLCFALIAKSLFFLAPAAVLYAFQKTFYWPGFHADFAKYGQDFEQGREIGNIAAINSLVFIAGPLLGGAVMHFFNFTALFIIVAVLIALSNAPLLLTPERFEPSEFSYKGAYARLFRKDNRRRLLAYIGFGEEFVAIALWPVFLYTVLRNTLNTGAVIALSTLITTIIVLYIGKVADRTGKRPLLRLTTVVYALSWFVRVLVRAPFGALLVDTFSRVGKNSLSVPLVAITYEDARERGVVKNVIFFEMALVVGKLLAMAGALLILAFAPPSLQWPLIFALSGMFALLYGVL